MCTLGGVRPTVACTVPHTLCRPPSPKRRSWWRPTSFFLQADAPWPQELWLPDTLMRTGKEPESSADTEGLHLLGSARVDLSRLLGCSCNPGPGTTVHQSKC